MKILNYSLSYIFRTIALSVLVALLVSVAFSEVIKEGSLQATSDGSNVTLRWLAEDESSVLRYEVEKRSGTEGDFVFLNSMEPHGASMYEFTDYSGMMKVSALYQYRVKVVFKNGSNPLYAGPITVTHAVSGVRRTWGSIKALFR